MKKPVARYQEGDAAKDAAISAAVIGTLMALVALGTHGGRTAASVGVGALIAVANLVMLSAIIRAIIRSPEEQEGDPTSLSDDGTPEPADREAADAAGPAPDHKAEGKRGGAAWGIFGAVKIVLLFGGIWLLLTRGVVDPIPLVVGYGVLPLGIVASSLLASLRPRR